MEKPAELEKSDESSFLLLSFSPSLLLQFSLVSGETNSSPDFFEIETFWRQNISGFASSQFDENKKEEATIVLFPEAFSKKEKTNKMFL